MRNFAKSLGRATAVTLALAFAGVAHAQAGTEVIRSSDHRITLQGKAVPYKALLERTRVTLGAGVAGDVVSTAYLRSDVAKTLAERPVIFVFNGGPITASVYLHFLAFGPKRLAVPDDLSADPKTFKVVDNQHTVLDSADLVFYDPVGTGYSRPVEGSKVESFFSVEKDGRELTEFIAQWSEAHGRLQSPKYIFGESYGTIRAAVVARQLVERKQPVRLDGVLLMGQALNIVETVNRPANVMAYTVSLPTLAALGWYHGKVVPAGRSFESFIDEARAFATNEYLPALLKGQLISKEELVRVSQRLEQLTGLPAKRFEELRLRVTKPRFRMELLADKGLVLGANDGRYTAKSKGPGDMSDASGVILPRLFETFATYNKEELGTPDSLGKYETDSPVKTGLDGWDWGNKNPFGDWAYMEDLRIAMQKAPSLKLFIATGYHDTLTTVGAAEHALAQSGWPLERVTMRTYQGGHMAYTIESSLDALMRDVRAAVESKQ